MIADVKALTEQVLEGEDKENTEDILGDMGDWREHGRYVKLKTTLGHTARTQEMEESMED